MKKPPVSLLTVLILVFAQSTVVAQENEQGDTLIDQKQEILKYCTQDAEGLAPEDTREYIADCVKYASKNYGLVDAIEEETEEETEKVIEEVMEEESEQVKDQQDY